MFNNPLNNNSIPNNNNFNNNTNKNMFSTASFIQTLIPTIILHLAIFLQVKFLWQEVISRVEEI